MGVRFGGGSGGVLFCKLSQWEGDWAWSMIEVLEGERLPRNLIRGVRGVAARRSEVARILNEDVWWPEMRGYSCVRQRAVTSITRS